MDILFILSTFGIVSFLPLFPTHGTEVTKSEMGFENDMGMINECDFANHELKKLVITGKTRAHCFVGEQQFVESDKDSDSHSQRNSLSL
ncbi:hypothetical protein BLNAU_7648 [Blattamonas nauphoetae]|uniref:Uncharacterized protein n=1 Tax=Blattamonas nauphoetae TaxID=2049346 RepID=A0ABQ9Y175_9EUKA|nr:hypothetical protein BLNAU_7648 [Blattamonas nauphoetae]